MYATTQSKHLFPESGQLLDVGVFAYVVQNALRRTVTLLQTPDNVPSFADRLLYQGRCAREDETQWDQMIE